MFRRSAFESCGGYRGECNFWEDLDLYLRMMRIGRIMVSTKPLFKYRYSRKSTRRTSELERVENAVDVMFKCRSAFNQLGRYDDVISSLGERGTDKLHPETFTSLAFLDLWSGDRPFTIFRLLRRGRLGFDRSTLRSLAFLFWAAAHPHSLRFIIRRRNRRKLDRTMAVLYDTPFLEWRPTGTEPPATSVADTPKRQKFRLFRQTG
jgi:hypothetical protein